MGKSTFQDAWLENPNYNKWIAKDASNCYVARCTFCMKNFDVSNMGESALKSHLSGKKHKLKMEEQNKNVSVATLFKAKQSAKPVGYEAETKEQSSSVLLKVAKNKTLIAEILWALKVIKSHFSYRSCGDIDKLFQLMFSDSDTAASFTCGEKKCSYICCFGLAPHFKNLLIEEMKCNTNYVLMFDETLNKYTQNKQLDIHVRLWQSERVITRYLTSVFLGHATAENILEKMKENCSPLPLKNILQLSMDGPNVNWKVFKLFQNLLSSEADEVKLLNIGSCSLHIVHNAFRHAATSCEFNVSDLLISIYRLFKDSPARREDLNDLENNTKFPLKFCSNRWLENSPVCERAIHIWPTLIKYEEAVTKKTLNNPNNLSFDVLRKWVKDPLALAKMHFFNSVVKELVPFLQNFQTDKPMLPFMAVKLEKMLRSLISRIVKPEILDKANTALQLINVDVLSKENCCFYKKVDIGFQAERELLKCSKLSERQIMDFRMECKTFIQNLVTKLAFKNPLHYSLVRNMKCFDPNLMVTESEMCAKNLKSILRTLVEGNRLKADKVDSICREYKDFVNSVAKLNSCFINFDVSSEASRVDLLFHQHMGSNKVYSDLWEVTQSLMILSHGQASVERGFSINKEVIVENLKENSIVAQRVIYDHISHVGGIEKVEMTKSLLQSVSAARQRYIIYLDEQNKQKIQTDLERKRKMLLEEMNEMKKKKKCLETERAALLKSADELAVKAESSRDFTFIVKSNSFRKTAQEKQNQISDVEQEITKKLNDVKNAK